MQILWFRCLCGCLPHLQATVHPPQSSRRAGWTRYCDRTRGPRSETNCASGSASSWVRTVNLVSSVMSICSSSLSVWTGPLFRQNDVNLEYSNPNKSASVSPGSDCASVDASHLPKILRAKNGRAMCSRSAVTIATYAPPRRSEPLVMSMN